MSLAAEDAKDRAFDLKCCMVALTVVRVIGEDRANPGLPRQSGTRLFHQTKPHTQPKPNQINQPVRNRMHIRTIQTQDQASGSHREGSWEGPGGSKGPEGAAWVSSPATAIHRREGLAYARARSLGADEGEGPAQPTERHSPSAATSRPVAAAPAP